MRKTRWRNRKGAGLLALALTLALAFSVTGALESRAADPIDLDAECTLTVDGSVGRGLQHGPGFGEQAIILRGVGGDTGDGLGILQTAGNCS